MIFISTFTFIKEKNLFDVGEKTNGIGLSIGEPSGLSYERRLQNGNSVTGALGFGAFGENKFIFSTHYTWNQNFKKPWPNWYIGVGDQIFTRKEGNSDGTETIFGVTTPLGISYSFTPKRSWKVFAEITPIFELGPDFADIHMQGSLGFRFFL